MIDKNRLAKLLSDNGHDQVSVVRGIAVDELLYTLACALEVVEAAKPVLLRCRRELRSYHDVDQLGEAMKPFSAPGGGE